MKWLDLHHPDICYPVVSRRIGLELVELLELTAVFLTRGGWGVLNRSCYPDQKAYRNAVYRLRKKGLVVQRRRAAETPQLVLTDPGRNSLPDYFDPERLWNKKWNGIWYMLIYDVPEIDRSYRDVLRRFLKRMRLGCLQQSVWVTPRDIRPQFDDLSKGACVDAFAFLFESRTVLGLSQERLVTGAWNVDRLRDIQGHYCKVMERNLSMLEEGVNSEEEMVALVRLALQGFHGAFVEDPLLPRALHPPGYLGEKVLSLHRELFRQINIRLEGV